MRGVRGDVEWRRIWGLLDCSEGAKDEGGYFVGQYGGGWVVN